MSILFVHLEVAKLSNLGETLSISMLTKPVWWPPSTEFGFSFSFMFLIILSFNYFCHNILFSSTILRPLWQLSKSPFGFRNASSPFFNVSESFSLIALNALSLIQFIIEFLIWKLVIIITSVKDHHHWFLITTVSMLVHLVAICTFIVEKFSSRLKLKTFHSDRLWKFSSFFRWWL